MPVGPTALGAGAAAVTDGASATAIAASRVVLELRITAQVTAEPARAPTTPAARAAVHTRRLRVGAPWNVVVTRRAVPSSMGSSVGIRRWYGRNLAADCESRRPGP